MFPGTFGVALAFDFLVLSVRTLPPRPWPLTVAGLPLFITTDFSDPPWKYGNLGWASHELSHLNMKDGVTDVHFDAVTEFLDKKTGVIASSVINAAGMWRITVPNGTDLTKLPRSFCQRGCGYIFESDIKIPSLAAFPLKEPNTA